MITRVLQSLRDAAWHPVDEQLVAFIDAEMGPRESARVRRHLARCWACRGRERRLRETIDAFMDAYAAHETDADEEALLPHPVRLPHAARAALRERTPALLARVSSAARIMLSRAPLLTRRSSAARTTLSRAALLQWPLALLVHAGASTRAALSSAAAHVRVRPATFVRIGAACATAAVIVLLTTGVPLSARQVVRHVDRAERGVLAATAAPVVYQRLEIAVRRLPDGATTGGTCNLWTDVERRRHHGGAVSGGAASDAVSGGAGAVASAAATPDIGASSAASRRPAHRAGHKTKADHVETANGKSSEADDALGELLAVFARHGMSAAWPVSLRSYEQVRAAADDAAEERVVSERAPDGERLLVLETTAVDTRHASIDTRLVVRERDWHPIEQRLTVREGRETTEFVVREKGFEVVSLATLPVAFFDAPPLHEPARATPDIATPEAAEVRPMPPAASDLVSAEVQAMFALHRVGLTAEDDIAVERRDSIVEVTGLAASAARRSQLTDAIARIKHVRARIRTANEVLSELTADRVSERTARALPARSASSGTSVEEAALAGAPVALRMDEAVVDAARLPVDRRADEASMRRAREAVRQSLALLERAWALRRLAEWSRRTNATTVTSGTGELIELMVREHAEAASKALVALDTTVTPSLQSVASGDPTALPATDRVGHAGRAWVDVATDFFGVAAEIDRDTRRLFTASSTPPTTTEAVEEARRLRDGLDRAAQWLLALRQPQPHSQPLPPSHP